MRKSVALLALAGVAAMRPLAGQASLPQARFSMHQMEINLYADTASGLHFVVGTTPSSGESASEARLIWLRFDPDSVLEWLNRAMAAVRVPSSGGPADAIQWSPTLHPLDGVGGLLVGHHLKKGKFEKEHYIAMADSAPGWQAEITAQQADSLLRLIFSLAAQARIAPSIGLFEPRAVDRPAHLLEQAKPRSHGIPARAVVQYVIGTDGSVEPASILVLAAQTPALETEAKDLVSASKFEPAEKGGAKVRQLARQLIVWQ